MSNLHKNLANDQLHNPKDFSGAANDTFLSKNASGNLEWKSAGAVSGVSQITAGTGITISPSSGIGNVTINSTATGGGDPQTSHSWRHCVTPPASKSEEPRFFLMDSPCATERTNPFHSQVPVLIPSLASTILVDYRLVLGSAIHCVDSTNPLMIRFNGIGQNLSGGNGSIALYAADFTGHCATDGELPPNVDCEKICQINFNAATKPLFCWNLETPSDFANVLTLGKLIFPVVAVDRGITTYSATMRFVQT